MLRPQPRQSIPVQKLAQKESERLLKLESILHKRVIGQEEAFNLIKKYHGIRIPAHLFAELSALLEAHISRRRAGFKPEFINRIDDIIVFHQLGDEDMKAIVGLLAANLYRRCEEQMDIRKSKTIR